MGYVARMEVVCTPYFMGEYEGVHRIPHFIKLDCSDMEYNDVDWIHLD